jgi:hypothetical protein
LARWYFSSPSPCAGTTYSCNFQIKAQIVEDGEPIDLEHIQTSIHLLYSDEIQTEGRKSMSRAQGLDKCDANRGRGVDEYRRSAPEMVQWYSFDYSLTFCSRLRLTGCESTELIESIWKFRSALHRVHLSPREENFNGIGKDHMINDRFSMPFFVYSKPEVLMKSLESQYMAMVLQASNLSLLGNFSRRKWARCNLARISHRLPST